MNKKTSGVSFIEDKLQRRLSFEELKKAYALTNRASSRMVAISNDQENSSLDKDVWNNILEDEFEKDDYFKEETLEDNSKRLVKSIFRK